MEKAGIRTELLLAIEEGLRGVMTKDKDLHRAMIIVDFKANPDFYKTATVNLNFHFKGQ